jgi:hypothetical protein
MPTSSYDVVVIGDELAGAVAAAHLARRGFRLLLLTAPPVEHDVVGPFRLPRAPLAVTGLETPVLRRMVNELNLLQLLRRRLAPNHPAFQLLLPDHRIDVSTEDLGRELGRELPEEAAAYERWAASAEEISTTLEGLLAQEVTLPPDGFWDRRDLKRMAAQLPDGDPEGGAGLGARVAMLARLPARFGTDLDLLGGAAAVTGPGRVPVARLADLHRRGSYGLDGGREALRALLHERVRAHAGEVRHDLGVRGLVMRRGRVTAVALGYRDEQVGCAQVICAMPAADVIRLLPEAPPRRLMEAAAVRPALHRYLLHVVAPLEALPDALGPFAFSVRDLDAPLAGPNALAIHVDHGHGQHAVLSIEALADDPSPDGLRALRLAVRAHLDGLLPFLDRHLVAVWSPHDGLPPEGPGIPAGAPSSQPATPPPSMDAIWSLPSPRPLGFCGVPHATGLKDVYLASRQVLPGLGFEGEVQAGWCAARLIASRLRRPEVDKSALLGT